MNDQDSIKLDEKPIIFTSLVDEIGKDIPKPATAQSWALRVERAVDPDKDLALVVWQFLYWLLSESGLGSYKHRSVRRAVAGCAAVLLPLSRGEPVDTDAAIKASDEASAKAKPSGSNMSPGEAAFSAWCAVEAALMTVDSEYSEQMASAVTDCMSVASASLINLDSAWARMGNRPLRRKSRAYVVMADRLIELIEAA